MMIKLHNADCLDAMRLMEDDSFELAIVDPPYGIGFDGNTTIKGKSGKGSTFSNHQHHEKKNWDSKRPPLDYFIELQRVSKHQIIWGGNYFSDFLPASRGWLYWDKKIMNANNKNFSDGELAWTNFNKRLIKFTYDWIGFGYINNPAKERKIHPTQKPVALYTWLLEKYAKQGDRILDTHLGSGSIAIACHNLGYDLTGYELDKDYYQAACKRLENHQKQLRMF